VDGSAPLWTARAAGRLDARLAAVPLPTRPLLKPALKRIWRDAQTLQLGLQPGRAVVVGGLEPTDAQVLDLLDGSRDTPTLLADAGRSGVDPARAGHLLGLLASADALDEPGGPIPHDARLDPDLLSLSLLRRGVGAAHRTLARRRIAHVTVHGAGRVGATVAGLLAAAGVGRVDIDDDGPVRPADLSPGGIREPAAGNRGQAATRALPRAAGHDGHAGRQLAVVAPVGSVAAPEVLAAVRHRPHLLVAVRETTALVGPLVLPGASPCVRCLELARADRDPAWPALVAQLLGSARAPEACDIALATLAAALAAVQALAYLDAHRGFGASVVGGVWEFGLADGRLRRRSVEPHVACGCGAAEPATGATTIER
jgi:bacteriocin biosynthesis cyclodehydratase domain-containing protein